MDRSGKLQRHYQSAALIVLNTIVVLVLANVCLHLLFRAKDARTARSEAEDIARIHENASLRRVYPDMDAASIHQLVKETWSRSYAYEPLTQFKERPFHGRFVNVSESGFRLSTDQGPWPPDRRNYNIFFFGGSTAFGYGVPDRETVASYLQEYLRAHTSRDVCVYNFGRSNYVSSQERVLFEQLLVAGHVPDMALFLDGLNDFAFPDGPVATRRLQALFDAREFGANRWQFIAELPMARLATFLRRAGVRAFGSRPNIVPNFEPAAAIDDGKYHDPIVITAVIDRYLENERLVEALASAHRVTAVFVWQPIPLYKYDLKHHLFATGDFGSNAFARFGYGYMERRMQEQPPGRNFLWCADMQESMAEPLYVDKVHYTASMSRLLASAIGDQLIGRGLLSHAEVVGSARSH